MKARTALVLAVSALGGAVLTGCGGSDESGNPITPTSNQAQSLDTSQVLALAQQTSEVSAPFAVNNDAIVITPIDDETSEPLSINGT
jgi:hypothetical protein